MTPRDQRARSRWWRRVLLVLALVLALAALELFVLRGRTPGLDGERSVAQLVELELGGAKQWVLIRGRDRTKPVLLFLHGGPGMPSMYLAHAFQREWERDFVVVHWDRRGAGKSFGCVAPGERLSVRQTLADTLELTLWLRERFGQERLLLVGHSFGSYLGLLAVRARPELYTAFVGTGQLAGTRVEADSLRRELAAGAARASGDPARAERIATGTEEVSEDTQFQLGGELYGETSFWPLLWTGLRASEYTLLDAWNVQRGAQLVAQRMELDAEPRPLEGEIESVAVPVFFFLGRHDLNTPSPLAAGYLERLRAPRKEVVWFERSAHFPFFEEPERFRTELLRVHATAQAVAASPVAGQR